MKRRNLMAVLGGALALVILAAGGFGATVARADESSPVVLKFQQAGTVLTITAGRQDDSLLYWRLKLDENGGIIRQFYDLLSPAGTTFNFCSPYGYACGLFAPYDEGIRDGGYTYTPGLKINGASTYTYKLRLNFGPGGLNYHESTVTIRVPTPEGTRFNAVTKTYHSAAAAVAVKAAPKMDLNAATVDQMNAIYVGATQGDLAVDGTLWSQVTVAASPEVAALGLTPGRSFRVTAVNLTDGTLAYDKAFALYYDDPYKVRNWVVGGIYDNYASKPPADSTVYTYTRLDINIAGLGSVPNGQPEAVAGPDQELLDMNANGSESVALDGSASNDPDGPIVSHIWKEGETVIANTPAAAVTLAVGVHTLTLLVTDDQGATAADTMTVTILPRQPLTLYVDQHHPAASDANPGTEAAPWLTLGQATGAALAGDTVIIKEGIYRESVGVAGTGTAEKPITFQAYPGHRVVVSGAELLTGWQVLPPTLAARNANFANIYYVDLNWKPLRLDENEQRLGLARSPNVGWWFIGAGTTGSTLVDTVHLVQSDPQYWVGAVMFFADMQPIVYEEHTVTAYDPLAGTCTVTGTIASVSPDTGPVAGVDRYYMYNKLELLDRPGEWVLEDLGGGSWRVYVWPTAGGDANSHMYEGTIESRTLFSITKPFIVLDGLELRSTGGYGHNLDVSNTSDVTIRNCVTHGSEYMGLAISNSQRVTVERCIAAYNGYGIAIGGSRDIQVTECEVHHGDVDGIVASYGCQNIFIDRCYIHDHILWGHPDNMQSHHGVTNMWIRDSALVNSGQSMMIEETDGLHFINTIVTGSEGYMLHGGAANQEVRGSTLAFSGYGLMALGQTGYSFHNNVYYKGHGNVLYGATSAQGYSSDNNVFYHGPDIGGACVAWNGSWDTYALYVSKSGQDANSVYADPLFMNAPTYLVQLEGTQVPLFSESSICLAEGAGFFAIGDHIETNFDGVLRTVTGKNGNWISYAPAHAEPLILGGIVSNWKTGTDYSLDLRVRPGSPAIGRAQGGGNAGSTVNLNNFRAGDLNHDGLRDLPVWPRAAATASAGLDYNWVYQNTPVTTGNRHQCLLTLSVGGATAYDVTVVKQGGAGEVVIVPTADPLVWRILGGPRQVGGGGVGAVTLEVRVTPVAGMPVTVQVPLTVRLLGDVDGLGGVSGQDKLLMNKRLNGLVPDGRQYDLDGLGGSSGQDKLILNKILNGLVLP